MPISKSSELRAQFTREILQRRYPEWTTAAQLQAEAKKADNKSLRWLSHFDFIAALHKLQAQGKLEKPKEIRPKEGGKMKAWRLKEAPVPQSELMNEICTVLKEEKKATPAAIIATSIFDKKYGKKWRWDDSKWNHVIRLTSKIAQLIRLHGLKFGIKSRYSKRSGVKIYWMKGG